MRVTIFLSLIRIFLSQTGVCGQSIDNGYRSSARPRTWEGSAYQTRLRGGAGAMDESKLLRIRHWNKWESAYVGAGRLLRCSSNEAAPPPPPFSSAFARYVFPTTLRLGRTPFCTTDLFIARVTCKREKERNR